MKIKNQADLSLFTDSDGVTWCRDQQRPRAVFAADLSLSDFISKDEIAAAERIRLLGFPSNAALICALWEKRDDIEAEVQIGTPAVCAPIGNREDPDVVFRQMQSLASTPASLGGMRPLTRHDYTSYCLVDQVRQGQLPSVEQAAEHPAWPAVSFVLNQIYPAGDSSVACSEWEAIPAYFSAIEVLAGIMDPRWHVDWQHPDRLSRLKMYMGVTPKHMRNAWCEVLGKSDRDSRARSILDAWTNGERQKPHSDTNAFLWDVAVQATGKHGQRGLRSSGLYLNFIRSVWLHMMRKDGRTLFVPEYFFSSKKDADAYESHQLLWEVDYDEA